jgi:hypothetical protein
MLVTELGMVMLVRPLCQNVYPGMLVSEFPSVTLVSVELNWKTAVSMEVTESGITTLTREFIPKALWPMNVTLSGMTTPVRLLLWNAVSPMAVTA